MQGIMLLPFPIISCLAFCDTDTCPLVINIRHHALAISLACRNLTSSSGCTETWHPLMVSLQRWPLTIIQLYGAISSSTLVQITCRHAPLHSVLWIYKVLLSFFYNTTMFCETIVLKSNKVFIADALPLAISGGYFAVIVVGLLSGRCFAAESVMAAPLCGYFAAGDVFASSPRILGRR
jgi:hypothetical protein